MTPRYIEYYAIRGEVLGSPMTLEYYYMPVNNDVENKQDMDFRAIYIWRLDTKRDTVTEIRDLFNDPKPLSRIQFLKIQLEAKPVPYTSAYLYKLKREAATRP